jgi:hypothetical protein
VFCARYSFAEHQESVLFFIKYQFRILLSTLNSDHRPVTLGGSRFLSSLLTFSFSLLITFGAFSQEVGDAKQGGARVDFFVHFQSPETSPFDANEGKGLLDWEVFNTADLEKGNPIEGAKSLDERAFVFDVQESTSKDFIEFKTRYSGKDSATYISGLNEGSYYYRVLARRVEDGLVAQSNPVHMKVDYVSMTVVWRLVALGVLVFAATIWVVARGGDPIEEPNPSPEDQKAGGCS